MPILPALKRLMQENQEFKTSLCYIASSRPAWGTGQESLHLVGRYEMWIHILSPLSQRFLNASNVFYFLSVIVNIIQYNNKIIIYKKMLIKRFL
jgi:hypothetical protein